MNFENTAYLSDTSQSLQKEIWTELLGRWCAHMLTGLFLKLNNRATWTSLELRQKPEILASGSGSGIVLSKI